MNHVMIDIETMGTGTDAAIVAIGAVLFDPETEQLGDTFYAKVDLADAVKEGGKIDAATVLWWLNQGDAAREELTGDGRVDIDIALAGLYVFIFDNTDEETRQVWANGASFDLPILTTAFHRSGFAPGPWSFWQERCYRTLKNIRPDIKAETPAGNVKHNALDDAKAQALHAIALLRAIAPQTAKRQELVLTVAFDTKGFDKMREDLAALPAGTQLFANVKPAPGTIVEVVCYWPNGDRLHAEFDHWPFRNELPADAVRFDIAWPAPEATRSE